MPLPSSLIAVQLQTLAFEQLKDQGFYLNAILYFHCRCDDCRMFPIVGMRYKCRVCEDFDFCEACFKSKKHKHPFSRIAEPGKSTFYMCILTIIFF